MPQTLVVDLSHWNPTPDWAKLKASGIVGVIHKATESEGYVDPTLFARAGPAMANGLKWSTYHFLRPSSDMTRQIDFYLRTINPVQGERVCLDHEDKGVTLADLKTCVQHIMNVRPDLRITIYSGHVIEEQLGNKYDEFLALNTDLWTCEYGDSTPEWCTGTWPQWTLFQYTDQYKNPAISAPVDGNYFNGGAADCAAWFDPASEPVPPEPGPDELVTTFWNVKLAVTATAGSKIDSVVVIDVTEG